MDELAYYTLLLRTAQGLTLLGTLRFQVVATEPLDRSPAGTEQLLAQAQQQSTTELFVYPMEGSINIPLLTGLAPVPLEGTAWFPLIGPFVTAFLSSTDQRFNVGMQLYELDPEHICGGLVWRSGESGELTFSLLGTLVRVPA